MDQTQTLVFGTELLEVVRAEIARLQEEKIRQISDAAQYLETFKELETTVSQALAEGADMEELLALSEIVEARRSTIERTLDGHPDILFNEETGEYIDPAN